MVHLVCHDTLCRYVLTLKLGPIQQFWFAEPDTDTNWVVRLVRHDTLCRYILTLFLGFPADVMYGGIFVA